MTSFRYLSLKQLYPILRNKSLSKRKRGVHGNLLFLGRKDRLVKVRGYRVELDEVEAVLTALEGVAEAGAVALRDENGSARIAAAVLPREGSELDSATLRRAAAQRLSTYAVPAHIEIRENLPRTGSGKIDRPALARELESG